MDQQELEAYLGRPLTSTEVDNLTLYLEIATERLEELLCSAVESIAEERTYDGREGYSTVFTDFFTEISSVTVDGRVLETDDYSVRQWNKRQGYWFNSIVLDKRLRKDCEIVIDGVWGFTVETMPRDLQLLQAKLFALVSSMNKGNGNVRSKKVEDFSISFNDNPVYNQFLLDNTATISKYSLCSIGNVKHGNVCAPYWSR
jgi:hypothetical protein